MTGAQARADRAFAAVAASLEAGNIPGAALGVLDQDAVAIRWGGLAERAPLRSAVKAETWWDLASLTKVMVTVPAVQDLVAKGAVALDDPIGRHLPDLCQVTPDSPLRALTVRALLSHQAGLPNWYPIYTHGNDANTLQAFVLQRDWPLREPVYSDLGYILLGVMIERLAGRRIADLPMGAGLSFRPDPRRVAATEQCPWRRRVIRGSVHDENADALGGAAGHAGLFGTAAGVLGFARTLLSQAQAGTGPDLARPVAPGRGLGWDLKTKGWAGGEACSDRTIGHLGFTGTSLHIDLDRRRAWCLLTNRVHPSRHVETGIMALRRTVADLVNEDAIGGA